MADPYAILRVYTGAVDASGVSEGSLCEPISRKEEQWDWTLKRRSKAREIIDLHLAYGSVNITSSSLVDTLENAQVVSSYVQEAIEEVDSRVVLSHAKHGKIVFSSDLHIPGYTTKNRKELVDILLDSPYQPTIPNQVYVGAEVMRKKVDERKERQKRWREFLTIKRR